jgi:hypothetical protein
LGGLVGTNNYFLLGGHIDTSHVRESFTAMSAAGTIDFWLTTVAIGCQKFQFLLTQILWHAPHKEIVMRVQFLQGWDLGQGSWDGPCHGIGVHVQDFCKHDENHSESGETFVE